jgi:hypothetical protein
MLRLHWLEGQIGAGSGRFEEARLTLSRVRAEFAALGIAYDTALVTLELAVLLLERGYVEEVKSLARQITPIFRSQGVHHEALAAIKLFCDVVEEDSISLEMARKVVKYLYRAQHNPKLRFLEP